MSELVFLKLGGSLITDKNKPHTARPEIIERVVAEINSALQQSEDLQVIIGHGSGSFGHVPGKKYQTRLGVSNREQWVGFAEVWSEARALNQIMVDAFVSAGLAVMAFPPSACAVSRAGKVHAWNTSPIAMALKNGIIPLVNGDVVFDEEVGGTILSTEDLFSYLAEELRPDRVLLAGIEEGVWKNFPQKNELIKHITPSSFLKINNSIGQSVSIDVTGGMLEKVQILLNIITKTPARCGMIFSGMIPGNITCSLLGHETGTIIKKE